MAEPVIALAPGFSAIVGYGSLLSLLSVQRTFEGGYDGPFVTAYIEGWRRDWSVAMPNQAFYYLAAGARIYPQRIHYLNAVPAPGGVSNCAVFVIDEQRLATMQGREWIYQPVDVSAQLRGVTVVGGPALMYVGRPAHVHPWGASARESAIRRSYLDIVERALLTLPARVKDEFQRTTDVPPAAYIIDDTLDRERPNPWAPGGSDYRPEQQLEPQRAR